MTTEKPKCPFTKDEVAAIRRNWLYFTEPYDDPFYNHDAIETQLMRQEILTDWEREVQRWEELQPEPETVLDAAGMALSDACSVLAEVKAGVASVISGICVLDRLVEYYADALASAGSILGDIMLFRAELAGFLVA